MIEYAAQILQDLLTMIYQYAGISIICSVLVVIVWKQAEESSWKAVWKGFIVQIKEKKWKWRFVLALYFIFVLQRTIFNRSPWGNPLDNVIGEWWIIRNGSANYEFFENVLLFLPLFPLVKINKIDEIVPHFSKIKCFGIILIPFECSLCIELLQLLLRAGSFQLSDLAFNTLGGVIGGLLYYIFRFINHKEIEKGKQL